MGIRRKIGFGGWEIATAPAFRWARNSRLYLFSPFIVQRIPPAVDSVVKTIRCVYCTIYFKAVK